MRRIISTAAVLCLAAGMGLAAADEHDFGEVSLFARVAEPGMPEGIIVRDGVVYVSTHVSIRGNAGGPPSRIFRYDLETGGLLGSIEIEGQNLAVTHGVLAMAFDADGALYVVDRNPGRVLRIDLGTEEQTVYATIPDLPACRTVEEGDCSPTTLDQATFADYIAFAPDGAMFVTDLEAATIFRVPAGGGAAEVWLQDEAFDGIFGLNGIAVDPSGERLTFAMTGSQQPTSPGMAIIYSAAIDDPSDLRVVHTYLEPAAGADGIAYGASGRLYVALAGHNQVSILEDDGTEVARLPDPVSNQLQEVPFDLPASIAFDGDGGILVTNQSFFAADPSHWAVLRMEVGDLAQPLEEPDLS